MVKVGFIVEGKTEKIVIDSPSFREWAGSEGIDVTSPVVDAKGGGNLLPRNIGDLVAAVNVASPDFIVILTDLENEESIEAVKARIGYDHAQCIFVAVKAIEAWFLADSQAMRQWLEEDDFEMALPEQTPDMPWDYLKQLSTERQLRGLGSKARFAKQMTKHLGFSIASAAQHPSCPSVKAFHDELIALGEEEH